MNIGDQQALRECTSCQMCAAVCPRNAINIELNLYGFYRPVIQIDKCINCGLCLKVCYRFDKAIKMTEDENLLQMPLYAASTKEDALAAKVTSGGIGDVLAKELITEGYDCIGVGYDDSNASAYHYIARTAEETDGFRGSKYIQSYSYPAFKELVSNCQHQRYAVFGTPCQIYAICRFLEERRLRDRFLLIDLYCHGCPSHNVWKKYQREVKEIIGQPHFDRVVFRSKEKGWGGFYIAVTVDGVKSFVSSPKKDEFYELFFSNQVLNDACSDCKLRGTLAYTDIRLGDFWGKKFALNSRGMSAVSLASKQGEAVFKRILSSITAERCQYSEFLPYQTWRRSYAPDEKLRHDLLESLSDSLTPLKEAVRILRRNENVVKRVRRYIKCILHYLPASLTRYVKRYIA